MNQTRYQRKVEPHRWALIALFVTTALGGCANFSPDGGMSAIIADAGAELGKDVGRIRTEADAAAAANRTRGILRRQLSVGDAVQIGLLNNRHLQAAYADLGFAEAQMVEASLPPSPTFSLARIVTTGELEIEKQILQNVLGLLTLPRRKEIAEARFRQAQVRAVEATLKTAADVRRAYIRAVAANRSVAILDEARTTAEALSDLAKKLGETGALSKLDQGREHAFTAEINGQLAAARLRQRIERERLLRVLGLWSGDTALVKLPAALRALPKEPITHKDVETAAVTRRVDLEIARQELEVVAKQLGLTKATRYIDILEVRAIGRYESKTVEKTVYNLDPGPVLTSQTEREKERAKWTGVELEFRIPLFDFGEARTRQAQETYMAAVHRLVAKAIDVRSEAREAYLAYRGAFDIARHYHAEIVPLRRMINDEMLLNYNGMLKDLFALLSDTKARISANIQANDAVRDVWLAETDLNVALVGGGGMTSGDTGSRPAAGNADPAGH